MNSGQRIVIVLLIASIIAGSLTGSPVYFRLSFLWGLLLVVTWVFSYTVLRGLQVDRRARFLRSEVGTVFEEKYSIRNPGRLPRLWIEMRDGSSLPGTVSTFVISTLNSKESRSFTSRTRLQERGIYLLGPTILSSGDPFGLFTTRRICVNDDSLLVYPRMFDIYNFPNPPGLLPGGDSLRRRTPQITSNASGVREYAPGDPMNRIHWVSTARRNRLITKEFELDPLADVWLFLDTFKSIHYRLPEFTLDTKVDISWQENQKFQLPPATIEYSVSIAASLARYYLRHDRAVGAVFSDGGIDLLPSDRGGRQLNKILEALAMLSARGDIPLGALVEAQARHLPRGSTIILITPSTSETLFNLTDILLRRGMRPVVVLIDASTFGGPESQDLLSSSLEFLRAPVYLVKYGVDLTDLFSRDVAQVGRY